MNLKIPKPCVSYIIRGTGWREDPKSVKKKWMVIIGGQPHDTLCSVVFRSITLDGSLVFAIHL
jgi:hypothetical protein